MWPVLYRVKKRKIMNTLYAQIKENNGYLLGHMRIACPVFQIIMPFFFFFNGRLLSIRISSFIRQLLLSFPSNIVKLNRHRLDPSWRCGKSRLYQIQLDIMSSVLLYSVKVAFIQHHMHRQSSDEDDWAKKWINWMKIWDFFNSRGHMWNPCTV